MSSDNDNPGGEGKGPAGAGFAEKRPARNKPVPADDDAAGPVEASPIDLPPIESSMQEEADEKSRDRNLKMILDLPVELHVELGQTRVTIQNVLGFGVGSVIELDRPATAAADIVVNGKLIGQGEVMVINENFGIRITKLVEPEKRIESL